MTLFADFNPNVSVQFSRVRQLFEDSALQAGVVGATDFKVAQRGAGANMSVDVPAGQAWVEVTTGTRNGIVHIVNDATANVVVTAAHATLPRIDQLILQYNDSSIPTGSGDVPTLAVLTGTATSGAQITNTAGANYRAGAVTLGNDRLRLADVLVPAASTSVVTANIVDRRPWARGAYNRIIRTSASYVLTNTTAALVDATNLQPRIECSGVPLRVTLRSTWSTNTSGSILQGQIQVDGVAVDGAQAVILTEVGSANTQQTHVFTWDIVPAAGSHLIGPAYYVTAGGYTLYAVAAQPLIFTVEEIIRPNASNT